MEGAAGGTGFLSIHVTGGHAVMSQERGIQAGKPPGPGTQRGAGGCPGDWNMQDPESSSNHNDPVTSRCPQPYAVPVL